MGKSKKFLEKCLTEIGALKAKIRIKIKEEITKYIKQLILGGIKRLKFGELAF